MIEDQINTAVEGFTSRDPVMGAVIIVLMVSNFLVFKIMNDFRKEAEARAAKEKVEHDETRAQQREEYRNMAHVTKTLEGLTEKVGELQRAQQTIVQEVIRTRS